MGSTGNGFGGSVTGRGFASFGAGEAKPEVVLANLGKSYCVTRCRFRLYPTIGACNAPLDILSDLIEKHGFHHRDVKSIRVGLRDAWVLHVGTAKRPHDVISAQASLGYSLGIRLVKGNNDMEMYTNPQLWSDTDVLAVADKFESYALADKAHPLKAMMEIRLADGRVLTGEQEDARGSEALPFGPGVIEGKFKRLARDILTQAQVEQAMHLVDHLDELSSIEHLAPSLKRNA